MNTTWISIAIIVITVSMIAYPIAQLIPRPADKRRMLLRQAAIKLGFQIQIRTPKIDERMRPIYPKLSQSVGYYLALKNSAYTETCTAIKNQNDNQWLWLNQRFPPDQQMASITKCFNHLPPFIEAIEFNRSGITFFISENVMLIENINDLKNRIFEELCL